MKKPLKIILIILAVLVGLVAALLIWLTATQLTELCKEDKAAISRTLSQLSSKGLVSCELPEHKRSYRTLYYLTEEGNTVVKKISSRIYSALAPPDWAKSPISSWTAASRCVRRARPSWKRTWTASSAP